MGCRGSPVVLERGETVGGVGLQSRKPWICTPNIMGLRLNIGVCTNSRAWRCVIRR